MYTWAVDVTLKCKSGVLHCCYVCDADDSDVVLKNILSLAFGTKFLGMLSIDKTRQYAIAVDEIALITVRPYKMEDTKRGSTE